MKRRELICHELIILTSSSSYVLQQFILQFIHVNLDKLTLSASFHFYNLRASVIHKSLFQLLLLSVMWIGNVLPQPQKLSALSVFVSSRTSFGQRKRKTTNQTLPFTKTALPYPSYSHLLEIRPILREGNEIQAVIELDINFNFLRALSLVVWIKMFFLI